MNGQALSATVFIYFACLSGAIAFGGLLGEKTRELIGIPETIIVSCVAGMEEVQSTRLHIFVFLELANKTLNRAIREDLLP